MITTATATATARANDFDNTIAEGTVFQLTLSECYDVCFACYQAGCATEAPVWECAGTEPACSTCWLDWADLELGPDEYTESELKNVCVAKAIAYAKWAGAGWGDSYEANCLTHGETETCAVCRDDDGSIGKIAKTWQQDLGWLHAAEGECPKHLAKPWQIAKEVRVTSSPSGAC